MAPTITDLLRKAQKAAATQQQQQQAAKDTATQIKAAAANAAQLPTPTAAGNPGG